MPREIYTELEQYKKDPSTIYTQRVFRRQTFGRNWEKNIGRYLVEKFEIKSACDFGCGIGCFLEGILESGVNSLVGIEYIFDNAKPFMSPLVLPFIRQGDASLPLDVGVHDFVMSIETAEHILPERSSVFADNLAKASSRWVFLTAAPVGQKGTAHINCRPKEDWIRMMQGRGFELQQRVTRQVGRTMRHMCRYKFLRKNLMIFKRG